MMTCGSQTSSRDLIGLALAENRLLIGVEFLLSLGCVLLKVKGIIHNPTLLIFVIAWLSLWLRRQGWRGLGLRIPKRWWWTVLAGIGIGVLYDAVDVLAITPLLHHITGERIQIDAMSNSIRGNLAGLLGYLALVWLLAAVVEECTYRGYLFNRMTDLWGVGRVGVATSFLVVSVIFGVVHWNQGATGVLDNVLAGALFMAMYLVSGRNLWFPIIVHGVVDTTSMILLYMGINLG
jgi:uncharacterized protein